jgi:hypothetical protein
MNEKPQSFMLFMGVAANLFMATNPRPGCKVMHLAHLGLMLDKLACLSGEKRVGFAAVVRAIVETRIRVLIIGDDEPWRRFASSMAL